VVSIGEFVLSPLCPKLCDGLERWFAPRAQAPETCARYETAGQTISDDSHYCKVVHIGWQHLATTVIEYVVKTRAKPILPFCECSNAPELGMVLGVALTEMVHRCAVVHALLLCCCPPLGALKSATATEQRFNA
jgi:hypothetical protein